MPCRPTTSVWGFAVSLAEARRSLLIGVTSRTWIRSLRWLSPGVPHGRSKASPRGG